MSELIFKIRNVVIFSAKSNITFLIDIYLQRNQTTDENPLSYVELTHLNKLMNLLLINNE